MARQDRRRYRRTSLRLRIARIEGLERIAPTEELWTLNVSAGGMFFRVPPAGQPELGTDLTFELSVPPGEGYSSAAGKVRGSGKVLRTQDLPGTGTGVAVEFTRPLALEF